MASSLPSLWHLYSQLDHLAMCNNKPALPVQRDKSLESQFGDIDVIVNQLVDKSFGWSIVDYCLMEHCIAWKRHESLFLYLCFNCDAPFGIIQLCTICKIFNCAPFGNAINNWPFAVAMAILHFYAFYSTFYIWFLCCCQVYNFLCTLTLV